MTTGTTKNATQADANRKTIEWIVKTLGGAALGGAGLAAAGLATGNLDSDVCALIAVFALALASVPAFNWTQTQHSTWKDRRIYTAALLLLTAAGAAAFCVLGGEDDQVGTGPTPTVTPTPVAVATLTPTAPAATPTRVAIPAATVAPSAPSATLTPTAAPVAAPTPTAAPVPTATPTIEPIALIIDVDPSIHIEDCASSTCVEGDVVRLDISARARGQNLTGLVNVEITLPSCARFIQNSSLQKSRTKVAAVGLGEGASQVGEIMLARSAQSCRIVAKAIDTTATETYEGSFAFSIEDDDAFETGSRQGFDHRGDSSFEIERSVCYSWSSNPANTRRCWGWITALDFYEDLPPTRIVELPTDAAASEIIGDGSGNLLVAIVNAETNAVRQSNLEVLQSQLEQADGCCGPSSGSWRSEDFIILELELL